jgi:hypothetical protein
MINDWAIVEVDIVKGNTFDKNESDQLRARYERD